jgi:hypothetical protein
MTVSQDLKQRLERKATFEAAVKQLTCAVRALGPSHTPAAAAAAELDLVPRVHTLLKARYSNPAFWKAGLELFSAVQVSTVCFFLSPVNTGATCAGSRCTISTCLLNPCSAHLSYWAF